MNSTSPSPSKQVERYLPAAKQHGGLWRRHGDDAQSQSGQRLQCCVHILYREATVVQVIAAPAAQLGQGAIARARGDHLDPCKLALRLGHPEFDVLQRVVHRIGRPVAQARSQGRAMW